MAQDGIVLTEAQLQVLEKRRNEKEAHGKIETQHPGYLGCQDTYYVGNFKPEFWINLGLEVSIYKG